MLGALVVVALLGAVALFALFARGDADGGEAAGAPKGAAGEQARPPAGPAPVPADPQLAEALDELATQGRGEDVHAAAADPAAETAIDQAANAFLANYLAYEVGELTRDVRVGLRATSTSSFAAELVRSTPRFPPGLEGRRPAPAEIVAVDVVDLVGEKAERAGVVVRLARRGKPEAAAFTLELRHGRWLVSGVTG